MAAREVTDSGFRLIVWGLDDLVSVSFERESSMREGGVKFFWDKNLKKKIFERKKIKADK